MKYVSYLLRLWSTEEEGEVRWRASLESPQGTRRLGFRSLEQLFAFLEDQAQAMEGKGRSFEKGPSDGQSV